MNSRFSDKLSVPYLNPLQLLAGLGLIVVLASAPVLGADAVELFVAPNGNDAWSGRLSSPSQENADGPCKTIPGAIGKARDARRQLGGQPAAITIWVRGGTYELSNPISLTQDDSGFSEKAPFTIAAYRNEKPILSGGRAISNWRPVEGKPNLWVTEIEAVKNGQWYFHQLFIDGKRQPRARTPNEGFYRAIGQHLQDNPIAFRIKAGDIKPGWVGNRDIEIVSPQKWSGYRHWIRSFDSSSNVVALSGNFSPHIKENNPRYYVENAPDAVDIPGEWHLDRASGVLTWLAPEGMNPNRAQVIAPKLTELLSIQGDAPQKAPARFIHLRGLTFAHTDWEIGANGYADNQAANAISGDVRALFATDGVIEDCTLRQLGGYALELGRGCQKFRVVGNEMSDIGAGGLKVGEQGKRSDLFEQNNGHVIIDNHLYNLGHVYPPAVGIFILQSGQNRVAHNHVHDLFYTAISVGWNWGYQETPCRENLIEFNHLHDIGKGYLSDMGGIYTLGIQKGTVIRNNLIHDVTSYDYGGWGIYPDEGSTDILIENNIVYRTKSAGFHQHYGRDNIVRNNIFAFGKEYQVMRTRAEPHTSFRFENNIIYFDSGSLLGSNWKEDRFVIDKNLYFDTRLGNEQSSMKFAGATLEEWRARGHDGSSQLADPRFEAPERYDFRLRSDSPALKLGFHPIDMTNVGVRPKQQRDKK